MQCNVEHAKCMRCTKSRPVGLPSSTAGSGDLVNTLLLDLTLDITHDRRGHAMQGETYQQEASCRAAIKHGWWW